MSLAERRTAIRHLINEKHPIDGLASYFAFFHPDNQTQIVTYPAEAARPRGFTIISRTGMDLFRPFITLRLPPHDMIGSTDLIHAALTPGTAVIANILPQDLPMMQALFDIDSEEHLCIFVLDRHQFQPIINVLVTQTTSHNQYPRFVIRSSSQGVEDEITASAGINWQTDTFADLAVSTNIRHRRQGFGRSVISSVIQYVLENGRIPLYAVSIHNKASIQLAQSVGFFDSGARHVMFQGVLKSRP